MDPRLPTDDDTNLLFERVVEHFLEVKYTRREAEALVREYYEKFTNLEFCRSIGIPTQDDDFFHHEGAGSMALHIYYYLCLKGDPDPHRFIEWRIEFLRPGRQTTDGATDKAS